MACSSWPMLLIESSVFGLRSPSVSLLARRASSSNGLARSGWPMSFSSVAMLSIAVSVSGWRSPSVSLLARSSSSCSCRPRWVTSSSSEEAATVLSEPSDAMAISSCAAFGAADGIAAGTCKTDALLHVGIFCARSACLAQVRQKPSLKAHFPQSALQRDMDVAPSRRLGDRERTAGRTNE